MKRFGNILVVYDDAVGGDDALSQAAVLARNNGARLTILTVLHESRDAAGRLDETEKRVQRLVASIHHSGVADVRALVTTGTPALQVVRQVLRSGHDLVIASLEAGNSLRERLLGATVTHLMRRCPCPVWVVKPGQSKPYARILAAVDPDFADDASGLDVKIMDLATALAARDRADLHVVHAWDVDGSDADTVRSEIRPGRHREILASHRRRRETAMRDLLSRYTLDGIEHRLHLPRERPVAAIRQLAAELDADLIVMGTNMRGVLPGLIAGRSAEQIVASVGCGLLAVKADAAESTLRKAAPSASEAAAEDRREIRLPSEVVRRVA